MPELWLIRHGETEWSRVFRHTGRTDLPLTATGEQQAVLLGQRLGGRGFAAVLTSPLRRARDTCRIAGYEASAQVDDDLAEWDYGAYEGLTATQIRERRPGWNIWDGGVEGGEALEAVAVRVDRVIARVTAAPGDVALFAHAHLLRILGARWLGLPAIHGRSFALGTASLSVLGGNGDRVVTHWNDVNHLGAAGQAP